MAKKTYIGVNNIARKVKKIYVGINGVARKIKKGYVGIGGVARLFFSGFSGTPQYIKTISTLTDHYNSASVCGTDTHAIIFGGGTLIGMTQYHASAIEAIDESFTISIIENITFYSSKDRYINTCKFQGNAVFLGGATANQNATNTEADVISPALTRTRYNFSHQSSFAGVAVVGNNMLLVGGNSGGNINTSGPVTSISNSWTRSSLANLSSPMTSLSGGTCKNHAIFGGGVKESGGYMNVSNFLAYDVSLTRTDISSTLNYGSGCASTGDFVLFAGGGRYPYVSATACAYNDSLTRINISPLSIARTIPLGVSYTEFAMFAGGVGDSNNSSTAPRRIDYYDASLTKISAIDSYVSVSSYGEMGNSTSLDKQGYAKQGSSFGKFVALGPTNKSIALFEII